MSEPICQMWGIFLDDPKTGKQGWVQGPKLVDGSTFPTLFHPRERAEENLFDQNYRVRPINLVPADEPTTLDRRCSRCGAGVDLESCPRGHDNCVIYPPRKQSRAENEMVSKVANCIEMVMDAMDIRTVGITNGAVHMSADGKKFKITVEEIDPEPVELRTVVVKQIGGGEFYFQQVVYMDGVLREILYTEDLKKAMQWGNMATAKKWLNGPFTPPDLGQLKEVEI